MQKQYNIIHHTHTHTYYTNAIITPAHTHTNTFKYTGRIKSLGLKMPPTIRQPVYKPTNQDTRIRNQSFAARPLCCSLTACSLLLLHSSFAIT